MAFTPAFEIALHHAMLFEVGPFWDPNDPDVIAGNYATREQRRKVGYVNIAQDRGGETKYGIAQKKNPNIVVADLDLEKAMQVYFDEYWLKGKCDQLLYPLSTLHFDGCVNHGVGRANRFLQRALGVEQDGVIGRMTLAAAANASQEVLIKQISNLRAEFYLAIVRNDPSQQMFLNGWMRRINETTAYCLAALKTVQ
jgi:lysozyme family protein